MVDKCRLQENNSIWFWMWVIQMNTLYLVETSRR